MVDQSEHSQSNDTLIDELYRRSAKDAPSASLDEAILKMARDDMVENSEVTHNTTGKGTSSPFSGNWKLSFSMAAVMVLGLVVILRLGVAPDKAGYESVYEPDYDQMEQTQRVLSEGVEKPAVILQKQVKESLPAPTSAPLSVPEVMHEQGVMENRAIQVLEAKDNAKKNEAVKEALKETDNQTNNKAIPVSESEPVKNRRKTQGRISKDQQAAPSHQAESTKRKAYKVIPDQIGGVLNPVPKKPSQPENDIEFIIKDDTSKQALESSGASSADGLSQDDARAEKEDIGEAAVTSTTASPKVQSLEKSIQRVDDKVVLEDCIRRIETLLGEGDMIIARDEYEKCIKIYPQQDELENLLEYLE